MDAGDGTVLDTCTGLIWQKEAGPERILWCDALLHCEGLTLAGHEFEAMMELRRKATLSRGILFGRLGALSLGVRMHGDASDVHLFNARKWYLEQPELAP